MVGLGESVLHLNHATTSTGLPYPATVHCHATRYCGSEAGERGREIPPLSASFVPALFWTWTRTIGEGLGRNCKKEFGKAGTALLLADV